MKPTKVAAVVAGSVIALGAATPAFAADNVAPASLNGAVDALGKRALPEAVPSDAVQQVTDHDLVSKVSDTAGGLNATEKAAPLLGGLPVGQ
ncbi:hypothetical protein I3F58_27390 [Streptomyces sp. MUM 203J]|uniref:hypothetical protein n=1 Tax=Streptomyces sp. MUM 203J TaxID=2791990 RepID=UPI001F03C383|nr:hypothetical protein [Streptomyces sp. MUM 203J]MCH0543210.1 hypothetical protein [Streptomyces sp. MUM 203J]